MTTMWAPERGGWIEVVPTETIQEGGYPWLSLAVSPSQTGAAPPTPQTWPCQQNTANLTASQPHTATSLPFQQQQALPIQLNPLHSEHLQMAPSFLSPMSPYKYGNSSPLPKVKASPGRAQQQVLQPQSNVTMYLQFVDSPKLAIQSSPYLLSPRHSLISGSPHGPLNLGSPLGSSRPRTPFNTSSPRASPHPNNDGSLRISQHPQDCSPGPAASPQIASSLPRRHSIGPPQPASSQPSLPSPIAILSRKPGRERSKSIQAEQGSRSSNLNGRYLKQALESSALQAQQQIQTGGEAISVNEGNGRYNMNLSTGTYPATGGSPVAQKAQNGTMLTAGNQSSSPPAPKLYKERFAFSPTFIERGQKVLEISKSLGQEPLPVPPAQPFNMEQSLQARIKAAELVRTWKLLMDQSDGFEENTATNPESPPGSESPRPQAQGVRSKKISNEVELMKDAVLLTIRSDLRGGTNNINMIPEGQNTASVHINHETNSSNHSEVDDGDDIDEDNEANKIYECNKEDANIAPHSSNQGFVQGSSVFAYNDGEVRSTQRPSFQLSHSPRSTPPPMITQPLSPSPRKATETKESQTEHSMSLHMSGLNAGLERTVPTTKDVNVSSLKDEYRRYLLDNATYPQSPPAEAKDLRLPLILRSSGIVGLGMLLEQCEGSITTRIAAIIPGFAADVSGRIVVGDFIEFLDGRDTSGLSLDEIKSITLGPIGSRCAACVRRDNAAHVVSLIRTCPQSSDLGVKTPRSLPAVRASVGLGVRLERHRNAIPNHLVIGEILPGYAVDIQGKVRIGDILERIDGRDTASLSMEEAAAAAVGLEGSQCTARIRRGKAVFDLTFTRVIPS